MVTENGHQQKNIVFKEEAVKVLKHAILLIKMVILSHESVTGEEDLMLITTGGVLIRIDVSDISQMGRNTQGVKLISIRRRR